MTEVGEESKDSPGAVSARRALVSGAHTSRSVEGLIYDCDLDPDMGVNRNFDRGDSLLCKRWGKGMWVSWSKWERENCGSGEASSC